MTSSTEPSRPHPDNNSEHQGLPSFAVVPKLGEYATNLNGVEVESGEVNLLKNAEKFINDEATLELIRTFPEHFREELVGQSLRAFLVLGDAEEVDQYLDGVRQHNAKSLTGEAGARGLDYEAPLIDAIAQKLGVDINTGEGKAAVYNYYQGTYVAKGYVFHAFNGAFRSDIETHGLTTERRNWDWKELEEVDRIGKRHNMDGLLGWGLLNSEGRIFVAEDPTNLYAYAAASPEWFSQFVGAGLYTPNEGQRKKAFPYQDHEMARNNVADICAKGEIGGDEKRILMGFFEKYWQSFTGKDAGLSLAIVETPDRIQKNWDEYTSQRMRGFGKYDSKDDVPPSLETFLESIDKGLLEDVPRSSIRIINLPDYDKIHLRLVEATGELNIGATRWE